MFIANILIYELRFYIFVHPYLCYACSNKILHHNTEQDKDFEEKVEGPKYFFDKTLTSKVRRAVKQPKTIKRLKFKNEIA